MSATRAGGLKAAATNKAKHGDDFYVRLGQMGGRAKVAKGFAVMPKEAVRDAGAKGGTISRRSRGYKTHCIYGHSLADAYIREKTGVRMCRTCRRLQYKARAQA